MSFKIAMGIGAAGLVINTLWHGNNWWLGTEAFLEAWFALIFGIGMGIKIGEKRSIRTMKILTQRALENPR